MNNHEKEFRRASGTNSPLHFLILMSASGFRTATPLFPAPAPRRKYPLEIKAGRLFRDGETNWVKPDEKKGCVVRFIDYVLWNSWRLLTYMNTNFNDCRLVYMDQV